MADETTKTEETKTNKPGWRTSEFWLATAAMVIGLLWASGIVSEGSQFDKVIGFVAAVLAQLGYTASRTLTKKKAGA